MRGAYNLARISIMKITRAIGAILITVAVVAVASSCLNAPPSTGNPPAATTTVTIETPVSRDQAVGIAAQSLPGTAISQSEITAQLAPSPFPGSDYVWWVMFDGFFLTGDQMADSGWHIGPDTHMSGAVDGGFSFAYFYIDPVTGTVIQKSSGGIWAPPYPILAPTPTVFTQLPPNELPIEIISVSKTDTAPGQPGGASVEISLASTANEGIVSLTLTLPASSFGPAVYLFDVSPSNPLKPGGKASETQVLLNAGENGADTYLLHIQGTFLNGKTFEYQQYVKIT